MTIYSLDEHEVNLPKAGRFWVAPDAHVMGRVTLGEDANVWFGAVVRGDNEPIVIGARTNLQEGVTMHVDPGFPITIGPDCTIGHGAILHGCTIDDECLIGMGAILLDNVKVGTGSLIGAGALVTQGTEIPPHSLVLGAPAKVLRSIREKERAMIDSGWPTYVEQCAKYKAILGV